MNDTVKPRPPNIYELHLDICEHCRNNPGSECEKGKALLAFACTGDLMDLDVPERPSAMDIVGMAYGQTPEETAQMKEIGKQVLGPWAAFL